MVNGQYFLKTFVVGYRIRTGLISAIYKKSLRISSAAKKDTTVGEIVNLMSVDAQRFFELVSYLHVRKCASRLDSCLLFNLIN